MQATSVTTDYLVALWVSIAALCMIDVWQGRSLWRGMLGLGAAVGLAVATKQTTFFYLAPFLVLFPLALLRRRGGARFAVWALLALLLVGLLDAAFLARNQGTYGNPAGPELRLGSQLNQVIDTGVVISNLIRNASLHLGTPSPHLNKAMSLAVLWVHARMDLDVNDPRTTAEGSFRVKPPKLQETVAGNLLRPSAARTVVPACLSAATRHWFSSTCCRSL
jgi:hypothetical protein